jgi:hypothetical protein
VIPFLIPSLHVLNRSIKMNLEVPIDHLDHMFDLLCKKLDVLLDKGGFMTMAQNIKGIDNRYVRDKLHSKMVHSRANGSVSINLNLGKLDLIAQYLDYENFIDFQDSLKINPNLLSFIGTYYSYVRKNDENNEVLRSPVIIKKKGNRVILFLQGKDRDFEGNLEYMEGCLFCLMKSNDKTFHHVYKVGKAKNPTVVQGVFSGVSSANNPIGGRCILIKQVMAFDQLQNEKIAIERLVSSSHSDEQKIGQYFEQYEANNLSINTPSGFDIDDLGY